MKRLASVVAVAALGLLPAIVDAAQRMPASSPAVSSAHLVAGEVNNVDFVFQPLVLMVGAGSTVTGINTGAILHSVTSDLPALDSGVFNAGGSFSMTFIAPGAYAYYCAIHSSKVGTIQVG